MNNMDKILTEIDFDKVEEGSKISLKELYKDKDNKDIDYNWNVVKKIDFEKFEKGKADDDDERICVFYGDNDITFYENFYRTWNGAKIKKGKALILSQYFPMKLEYGCRFIRDDKLPLGGYFIEGLESNISDYNKITNLSKLIDLDNRNNIYINRMDGWNFQYKGDFDLGVMENDKLVDGYDETDFWWDLCDPSDYGYDESLNDDNYGMISVDEPFGNLWIVNKNSFCLKIIQSDGEEYFPGYIDIHDNQSYFLEERSENDESKLALWDECKNNGDSCEINKSKYNLYFGYYMIYFLDELEYEEVNENK